MRLAKREIKKELKLEELNIRQKIGMTMCAHICPCPNEKNNVEYALGMIRDKALGAVWVDRRSSNLSELMERIYETAEYPIIIVCDAESGIGDNIIGKERLTSRTVSLIEALQVTKKVFAVLHYGNPYVLEDLPHVPRVLVAGTAPKTAMYAIDVLVGKYEAKGVLTHKVKLK